MNLQSFALIVADARPSLLTTRTGRRLRALALALARANVAVHTSVASPGTGPSWSTWGRSLRGYRTSAFHRSSLAEDLRADGVRHVLIAGGADGVFTTARHALDAGFEVTIVTDATSVNAAFARVRLPFARCRDVYRKLPRPEQASLTPRVSALAHPPNTCMAILAR